MIGRKESIVDAAMKLPEGVRAWIVQQLLTWDELKKLPLWRLSS